jgi:hypothetical protein
MALSEGLAIHQGLLAPHWKHLHHSTIKSSHNTRNLRDIRARPKPPFFFPQECGFPPKIGRTMLEKGPP